MSLLARAAVLLVVAALASPVVAPAQTPPTEPCYGRFEGVPHDRRDYTIFCTDGDPACDVDGDGNHMCTFRLMVCAEGTGDNCGQHGTLPLRLTGAHLQLPKRHAHQRACGHPADIHVPLTAGGTKAGERFLHLYTGKRLHPRTFDRLDLHCLPGN